MTGYHSLIEAALRVDIVELDATYLDDKDAYQIMGAISSNWQCITQLRLSRPHAELLLDEIELNFNRLVDLGYFPKGA